MENVYEAVQFFYNANHSMDSIIKKSWVEKFLRKKAWAGRSDRDMKKNWQSLQCLFSYLQTETITSLQDLTGVDYVRAVLAEKKNKTGLKKITESKVKEFFFVVKNFMQYLDEELDTEFSREVMAGMQYFYIDGSFQIPQLDMAGFDRIYDNLNKIAGISQEDAEQLNVLLENLLNKIGVYYKGTEFSQDFNRALALFAGPMHTVPEEENEEFWLGFWDYFLFDYHLIKNDATPLRNFYDQHKNQLQTTELRILQDLLKAEFTVFYINYIREDDVVECINLFTNEKIYLPQPDFALYDYQKVLLYGHLYLKGVVMLNYITSVPVSPNLRKRIKEEVLRQHQVYCYQQKKATLQAFFQRHSIVVRHTIDILVRLAKVNVVSPELLRPAEPKCKEKDVQTDEKAEGVLHFLADRYHFSLYARNMLLQMWKDVCAVLPAVKSSESRALSVFLSFTTINGVDFINKKVLLSRLHVKKDSFEDECEQIAAALRLRIFDPRYLTEEGFVLSLYAF